MLRRGLMVLALSTACSEDEVVQIHVTGEVLATEFCCTSGLQVAGDNLYYVVNIPGEHINTLPKTGGPVTTLVNTWDTNVTLVYDNYLYWVSSADGGEIYRLQLPSGVREEVLPPPAGRYPVDIAVDESFVYWVDSEGLWRLLLASVPQPAGGYQTGSSGGESPPSWEAEYLSGEPDRGSAVGALLVDSVAIYWHHYTLGYVAKMSFADMARVMLTSDIVEPVGMTQDDAFLYVADWNEPGGLCPLPMGAQEPCWTNDTLLRVDKNSGQVAVLARDQSRPVPMLIDGDYLYWTRTLGFTTNTGQICRFHHDGGPIEVLAENLDHPTSVAIDEEYIYWTTEGRYSDFATISRTPKDAVLRTE